MFDATGSSYAYGSNPAASMLEDSMSSMMGGSGNQTGGVLGQRFGDVMNSMIDNMNNNAQQGIMPFFNGPQYNLQAAQAQKLGVQTFGGLTAAQISQQMSIGGPLSVLPFLGGVNKFAFPAAGLWTLYSGIKEIKHMNEGVTEEVSARFDPSQLNYNRAVQDYYDTTEKWQNLGPFH
jgi:hypothetical protein